MPVSIDLTDEDIYTALRTLLLAILPSGIEVIEAQINRAAPPKGPDYVVMNGVNRSRLSTNVENWTVSNPNPVTNTTQVSLEVQVQIDIHGPNGADNSTIIEALFRSGYGCDAFAASGFAIQPLYVDEAKQIPFIDGEQQYEDRWTFNAHMQANPVITRSQDFANQAIIDVINVDATYPPGG